MENLKNKCRQYCSFKLALLIILIFSISISWSCFGKLDKFTGFIHNNWEKDVINSVMIVSADVECPNSYFPLLDQQWDGLEEGCLCNSVVYSKEQCQNQPTSANCIELNSTKHQITNIFGFYEQNQSTQVLPWKICGEQIKGVNFYSQLTNLEDGFSDACDVSKGEKLCILDGGKVHCAQINEQCPSSIKECKANEIKCDYTQYTLCFSDRKNCPILKDSCSKGNKSCQSDDRIYCIDQKEDCPITDIKILSKTSPAPEGYTEELIKFESNYKLYVMRNNPKQKALIDFKISNENGVCLDGKSMKFKNKKYSLDSRTECESDEIDLRFISLNLPLLPSKEFFKINDVDFQDHKNQFVDSEQYQLYSRGYLALQEYCNSSVITLIKLKDNFSQLKSLVLASAILGIAGFIFQIFNLLFKFQAFQIQDIIQAQKFAGNYLVHLVALAITVLSISCFPSIVEQVKNTQDLLNDECFDQFITAQLQDYHDFVTSILVFIVFIFLSALISTILSLYQIYYDIEDEKSKIRFILHYFLCLCSCDDDNNNNL